MRDFNIIPDHIKRLDPYKAGKSISELKEMYHLDRVVKLASNENPMGPSPLAAEAIRASINELHRYPKPGFNALRTALAERFNLNPESIIAGNGSEGIMSLIVRTFFRDDDEALTSEGTFIGFRVLVQSRGMPLKRVPLKEHAIDLDAIREAISEKTRVIYLANPNNPTGTYFTREAFLRFYENIPPRVLLIIDEAYFEFCMDKADYPDSMTYRFDNVITLRTFSKAYGIAGARIGYGFAHPDLISPMMKVKLPFEPSVPAQSAGLAALNDQNFLNDYLAMNKRGIRYLYEIFERHSIAYIPSSTNFVTIIFESEDYVNRLNDRLLRKGVIVRPLKAFGLPNCIRVTAGLEEENQFFAEVLEDVFRSGF